jgi:hypothetical protein
VKKKINQTKREECMLGKKKKTNLEWDNNLPFNCIRKYVMFTIVIGFICTIPITSYADGYMNDAISMCWYYPYVSNDCKLGVDVNACYPTNLWRAAMTPYDYQMPDFTLWPEEFVDIDIKSWGRDHTGYNLDDGDALFVVGHGFSWDGSTNLGWLLLNSIEYSDNCYTDSLWYDMGDDEAEFIHIIGCHSCNYTFAWEYRNNWGLRNHANGLHQYGGYHGVSSTATFQYADDFADDAFDGPISFAWISNMTVWDAYGPGSADNCAVNVTFGNSWSNTLYRLDYEQYDYEWSDPIPQNWFILYYCGCDAPGTTCDTPDPPGPPPCGYDCQWDPMMWGCSC